MTRNDLHDYQLAAVDHIMKNKKSGLFIQMGLGKTVSTLTALNQLIYEELEIMNALVIAPKRVVESVWAEEVEKWDHIRHLRVVKVIGNQKQRKKALSQKADIYLISRDNVQWLCGLFGGSSLPFDACIIDESSSFKNPKSVRFKALRGVQPCFKYVVILTGTPSPNGLIDLWSQIYLLDRGERLGKFITKFREEYFRPDSRRGDVVFNYKLLPESKERIYDRIKDICMSMKAEDYIKLPGRIDNIIKIRFTPELKKQYTDFERTQVMRLMDLDEFGEISAANAAALSNKLLQFANGAVYDDSKKYHVVHDLKIQALREILEDANENPVLIAWTYRSDMERIKKELKAYNPVELKTNEDIEKWNRGEIQCMMMHPASGGHGLNLQAGGHIIVWFGQTWSLELEEQFNARLDRQGQNNVVVINKLVVEGTMDEDVIAAQMSKSEVQNDLMSAVKARIKKYTDLYVQDC